MESTTDLRSVLIMVDTLKVAGVKHVENNAVLLL